MEYTIILSDGTRIEHLELNGNNYVSQEEVSEDVFQGKTGQIIIEGSDGSREEHTNWVLLQIRQFAGMDGWYIAFEEVSEQSMRDAKIRADIDFIAMETGVDLEV